jgi:CheY-like chemotaxis protein
MRRERRPVALREVIEQAAEGVRPLMKERHHRFNLDLPDMDLLVDGDPVRLSQILLNLLVNAANYTQEGGEIRITTEAGEHVARVRVQDNGPGIPPEQIEELFTPFAQGECRLRGAAGGLGLGLTISRRLAELHGGRLAASSNWPMSGSAFTLSLPRLRQAAHPTRPEQAPRSAGLNDLSVLVVDDNADVADALSMLLAVLGCRVESASCGAEALAMTTETCPRVALVDIGLPDMDGLELARRLRARYPTKDRLLLVAVTGYGHDEARERSHAAGFDQHLAKPVELQTLQNLLETLQT